MGWPMSHVRPRKQLRSSAATPPDLRAVSLLRKSPCKRYPVSTFVPRERKKEEMKAFGKKLASVLVAGSLALTGLVGCAGGAAPEPKDATELMALFDKTEKTNNHAELTMNMSVDLLGQALEMPITGSFDTVGEKTHGTMTMDLGTLGIDKIEMETYSEKEGDAYIQYMSVDGENWIKQTTDAASFTSQITNDDILASGEFSKTDSGYQITVTGDKLMGAISAATGGAEDSLLGGDEAVLEALKGTNAVFVFDKDAQIASVTMDMDMGADDATGSSASVKLSLDVKFSNHGKIEVSTVTVPDTIKSGATDLTAAASEIAGALEEVSEIAETVDSADASSAATSSAAESAATSSAADATSADATSADASSAGSATSAEASSTAESTSAAA